MLNEGDEYFTGQSVADGTDAEDTGFGDVDDIGVYVGEDAWLSVGLLKGGGGVERG